MIIAFILGGQAGNQLMYTANMMATSIEGNVSYRNISFEAGNLFEIDDEMHSKRVRYNKWLAMILTQYMYGNKKLTGNSPGIKSFLDEEQKQEILLLILLQKRLICFIAGRIWIWSPYLNTKIK